MSKKKEKELLARFSDAPFILKATMWTPDRNTLDMEFRLDENQGRALLFIVANSENPLTKEQQAAVELLARSLGQDDDD